MLGWSEAGFVYLMSTLPISECERSEKGEGLDPGGFQHCQGHLSRRRGSKGFPSPSRMFWWASRPDWWMSSISLPAAAISLQWFTKIKYITDLPLLYLAGAILMKKETFKEIPSSFQPVLMEIAQRHLNPVENQ